MSDNEVDPNTHRMIQTREGVVAVPRTQKGIPLNEYFHNAEFPKDLNRSLVFATSSGPVLAKPDPVAWNRQHDVQASDYAERLKAQIEEKGYYARTLNLYAGRLADITGHPVEEMKAVIVNAFERDHGKDPFNYLQDRRREQGLSIREGQDVEPNQPRLERD